MREFCAGAVEPGVFMRNDEHRRGAGATTEPRQRAEAHRTSCGCDIDIHIDSRGDVNIYNCTQPSAVAPCDCPPCPPPSGTCIPVAAGAKHKLSREQKLGRLEQGTVVPSSIAGAVMHMMRRFLLDETPATALETSAFESFGRISRDLLRCTLSAFDSTPAQQRSRLVAQSLVGDPSQPLDEAALTAALGEEIVQRAGGEVFGDPNGMGQERPGQMRVYEPQGEDFFSQVRICRINDLRTGNFIPVLDPSDYLPAEVQHDCTVQIVDGQPQVVCQVRTTDCPGNSLGAAACGRVLDVAFGDGVILEGVNYFSVDAKVRFSDSQTGNPVRDVDAQIWGDIDTPATEVVNGETRLINDCRVHDRLTFSVPDDLAPGLYTFNVVVPNITGIAAFGPELISNTEYLNVVPSPTTRFEILTERIIAREETSPAWWGSDEVGLHTMGCALDGSFPPQLVDLPDFTDPNKRANAQEQRFADIQGFDFDSGTHRDITRKVFAPDKPFLGMVLIVLGDEIDSQHAYDNDVRGTWDNFVDLVKDELPYIGAALGGSALDLVKNFSWTKLILTGIGLTLLAGIDYLIALWAPADPIIRDSIALSVNDLATLTSSNMPAPDPTSYTSSEGIVVNVNKTIPPVKLPLEYHETREYVCADQDSRYEITYRFARAA